jgi:hypothetical protein
MADPFIHLLLFVLIALSVGALGGAAILICDCFRRRR